MRHRVAALRRGCGPLFSPYSLGMNLLRVLLPPLCLNCAKELDAPNGVCRACRAAVRPINGPVCDCCGTPLGASGLCLACQTEPPAFEKLRVAAVYAEPLSCLLAGFKYRRKTVYKRYLAELLDSVAMQGEYDLVTFVPLHFSRQLRRVYNQAALLARELARLKGLRCSRLISKTRRTQTQVGLERRQRRRNLRGVFKARPVDGLRILLIDDVVTTGATMRAAAAALKAAGAAEVHCLGVARALR